MSNDHEDKLVLDILLKARAEVAPDLDEALLRQCYAIQRRYQFSESRVQSSAAMERIIDEAVNSLPLAGER